MGAASHQPCYTQVISKTLIKAKDANCTRLCCLCCGSVMASTLPWARSPLLHRGCFALSCLFSSYWGFWQDSRCLPRVVEQEGGSCSAGHVQVNPPHSTVKSHSTQSCCPPQQQHPGAQAGGLPGCGELEQAWSRLPGAFLGRCPDGLRSPRSQSPP